jgi:DNA transformation protein and related proteins
LAAPDPDHIAELFATFGRVTVRRMFSGAGLFADSIMFAIVVDGVIFLKADERTIPRFQAEGLKPFTYATKAGPRSLASYWRMPERLYDDPDELAQWATAALQAARRGARMPSPRQLRSAAAKRPRRNASR